MPGFWWWECARAKSRDRQSAITRRARCHLSNPLSIIPMFAFSQTILTDYRCASQGASGLPGWRGPMDRVDTVDMADRRAQRVTGETTGWVQNGNSPVPRSSVSAGWGLDIAPHGAEPNGQSI